MARGRVTALTGRNVKRRGQGLTEDDLAEVSPQEGGNVTSGETVTLGAGSKQPEPQPQPTGTSETSSASS